MRTPLAIVILNYRTPDLVLDCLNSLEGQMERDWRAVVVDNASGDGSAERFEEEIDIRGWAPWARVIRSPVNDGFAAGNNLGIRTLDAEAYVLLNSDTLVRPGALAELLRAMRERPDAGLIGPSMEDAEGEPTPNAFRIPVPLTELVRAAATGPITRLLRRWDVELPLGGVPMEPGWIGFACALIRREVFDQVGLLDAGYFMYFEDIDYCRRARAAGWTILYWPAARVVHLLGRSSEAGVTSPAEDRRRLPRYYYEARARYFAKFHGRLGLWMANLCWSLGRLVASLREVTGTKSPHHREGEARHIWINALRPVR